MIRRAPKLLIEAGSLDELLASEAGLAAAALALGAAQVGGAAPSEKAAGAGCEDAMPRRWRRELIGQIRAGADPLGDAFCRIRSPAERRPAGAVYTPPRIVRAMGERMQEAGRAQRIVDPGTGSGRFLVDAASRHADAELVGFDTDPLAAIIARANLAVVGAAPRARILVRDFCRARLARISGTTLFIGNPPYVRHHDLPAASKQWLAARAARSGLEASRLAGLHVHFFLATLLKGRPGDYGAFITAAEWLDVNYGSLVRQMLLSGLGGRSITIIDPAAEPFPGIAATGAITSFRLGTKPRAVHFMRVGSLDELGVRSGGKSVARERLERESRWSHLARVRREAPSGYVELGELCRVHRGQVTGANRIWIAGAHSRDLPDAVLFKAVTKAREVIRAGGELSAVDELRCVIDLPVDLDRFDAADRRRIDDFLGMAKGTGAHEGYIARTRKAWWSVGLRAPAAILATYMARRPPVFALNSAGARHINIAHGLYPRETLDLRTLRLLVAYLGACASQHDGRTYAGGLTKFEPREMQRIMVPPPSLLADVVAGLDGRGLKAA